MKKDPFNIDKLYQKSFEHWEAPYDPSEMESIWKGIQQKESLSSQGSESASSGSSAGNAASSAFKGAFSGLKGWFIGSVTALVIGSGAFYYFESGDSNTQNSNNPETHAPQETNEPDKANPDLNIGQNPEQEKDVSNERGREANQLSDKPKSEPVENQSAEPESGTNKSASEKKTNSGIANTGKYPETKQGENVKGIQNSDEQDKEGREAHDKALPKVLFSNTPTQSDGPTVLVAKKAICPNETLTISKVGFEPHHKAWIKKEGAGYKPIQKKTQISWASTGSHNISFKLANQKFSDHFKELTKTVEVNAKPKADFDYTLKGYRKVFFENLSKGASQFEWYFGDGKHWDNKRQPVHSYSRKGEYRVLLIAGSQTGCSDTMEKTIDIKPRPEIEIPNTFTPNGDGYNDQFVIKNLDKVAQFYLMIKDKEGNQVFETRDPKNFWNGKMQNSGKVCDAGRYQYVLKYRFPAQDEMQSKSGRIRLLKER